MSTSETLPDSPPTTALLVIRQLIMGFSKQPSPPKQRTSADIGHANAARGRVMVAVIEGARIGHARRFCRLGASPSTDKLDCFSRQFVIGVTRPTTGTSGRCPRDTRRVALRPPSEPVTRLSGQRRACVKRISNGRNGIGSPRVSIPQTNTGLVSAVLAVRMVRSTNNAI